MVQELYLWCQKPASDILIMSSRTELPRHNLHRQSAKNDSQFLIRISFAASRCSQMVPKKAPERCYGMDKLLHLGAYLQFRSEYYSQLPLVCNMQMIIDALLNNFSDLQLVTRGFVRTPSVLNQMTFHSCTCGCTYTCNMSRYIRIQTNASHLIWNGGSTL